MIFIKGIGFCPNEETLQGEILQVVQVEQVDYDYHTIEGLPLSYEDNRTIEEFIELLDRKGIRGEKLFHFLPLP
jgi:hypothetical protein